MDLLSENNTCGQRIVQLCSRGNAIIAELLRLSEHIPPIFRLSEKEEKDSYGQIVFDFQWMRLREKFDEIILSSPDLMELDEGFRESHLSTLERFYQLFESMYNYIKDLLVFFEELEDGYYIQHSLDILLMDVDGKQLVSESVYLYGVMLLLMDQKIDGVVRERMIVSYLRYQGLSDAPTHTEVCKLCRQTGYTAGGKRPPNYPDEFLQRFPIDSDVMHNIIGRLRSDDMYNQRAAFPAPDHRSAAFGGQASMLFVTLYFVPELLHEERPVMREICDRYFPDNWVIPFYMGFTIDLFTEWEPYKAAKEAIRNTIQPERVKELHSKHVRNTKLLYRELRGFLTEGSLTNDYLLDNTNILLNCMRGANTTIRWLMLHRTTEVKKLRDLVVQEISENEILLVLLKTAQFEYQVKSMFQKLLDTKDEKWADYKSRSAEHMTELSEYFSGEKPLARVAKDESLQAWFANMGDKVGLLDHNDSLKAGRKIQQISKALEEVEQYHQIATNLHVKQYLEETRTFLRHMVRTANVKEEVMIMITSVCELAYGWGILHSYIPLIHNNIKRDPFRTLEVRALILKLVSILEVPLLRMKQCDSKDLESTAEYYSTELVVYVRKVLEIIPINVFTCLKDIINIRTTKLKELPTRVVKTDLKEYAQLEERFQLARATHEISIFTRGILAMETTLIGIIEVNPQQLLEDGVRVELVRQLATVLHTELQFKDKQHKVEEMEQRLNTLARRMDGFLRSFEYIQDYINIYGLKIWQEEFSRIINYNVEQECNSFLKKKVYDWQSAYQSTEIPIPKFRAVDGSVNFVGRLTRELIRHTDPAITFYVGALSAWVDKTGQEVVGMRLFNLLHRSVGIFGLHGIDRLLCFMVLRDLRTFELKFDRVVDRATHTSLKQVASMLEPLSGLGQANQKLYTDAVSKFRKTFEHFVVVVSRIGQQQLLRGQIRNELNLSSKVDSNTLACAIDTLNMALMVDVHAHYRNPEDSPYPRPESEMMTEFAKYLEAAGFNHPVSKIYLTIKPLDDFPCFLFLLILSQISKLTYERAFGGLICTNKKEPLDGVPFVMGIITVLKQFHSSVTHTVLAYLGQFVRSHINSSYSRASKAEELSQDVLNVLIFLEDFCKYGYFSRKVVEGYLPPYIFDFFKH